MSSGVNLLTPSVAQSKTVASLGLCDSATAHEVFYEIVRAAVCALTDAVRPVHILRLLNRTVEAARASVRSPDEQLRAELKQCLRVLADVGDLVELDGGRWLPSPVRLVNIGRADTYMLVGGVPTRLFSARHQLEVTHRGPFRHIQTGGATGLPIETLSAWARVPPESLQEWSDRLLSIKLGEYSPPHDGVLTEIYLPDRARHRAPQFKRWFDNLEGLTGRFLARRARVWGTREYWLVEASDGQLVGASGSLAPREARRLMYAFDRWHNNPTVAGVQKQCEDAGEFVLTSDLPGPEHRTMGVLGTLELSRTRVYERRWVFESRLGHALDVLRTLSIDLEDKGGRP